MSRMGISYQEVVEAITKLQDRGKTPTVDRIRESLGTGSNSTITRYLREWKSGGMLSEANTVPAELLEIVKDLWAKLQAKAEQQITTVSSDAAKTIQTVEAKFIQLQKEDVDLQAKVHKLEENLYAKAEENKAINKAATAQQLELAKLSDRYITLEKNLSDQKLENKRLHDLLNNIQKNLEHYQLSIEKLQQEQSMTIEKQTAKYEQKVSLLKQQLADNSKEKDKFKMLAEQSSSLLKKTECSLQETTKNLKAQEINAATIQDRYSRLAEQHELSGHILERKNKLLTETAQKLETTNTQMLELKQALKGAEDKVQTLRHEQLFLVQEKANFEGQLQQFQKFTGKSKAIAS